MCVCAKAFKHYRLLFISLSVSSWSLVACTQYTVCFVIYTAYVNDACIALNVSIILLQ